MKVCEYSKSVAIVLLPQATCSYATRICLDLTMIHFMAIHIEKSNKSKVDQFNNGLIQVLDNSHYLLPLLDAFHGMICHLFVEICFNASDFLTDEMLKIVLLCL